MILKLCNPNGNEQYVSCDTIQRSNTSAGYADTSAWTNGVLSGRWLIGYDDFADYERAYVMENGKTVDKISLTPEPVQHL